MLIGIDGSRAFIKRRTGIEEYSYQVIKNLAYRQAGLRGQLLEDDVVLYLRKNQTIDFGLPQNWKVKIIKWPRFWTQAGLSLEIFWHPVDTLFIPAHTVPIIHPARNVSLFSLALLIQKILKTFGINTYYNQHSEAGGPKNTIVTIHGLEYEFCELAYSFWEKIYMRYSIINSCKWAHSIIAVSNNTKQDLVRFYGVNSEKIKVILEGYNHNFEFPISNFESNLNDKISKPYLLFIGRIEERKNIVGIISAFEILKEKYKIPHKLVLAGKPGFGYQAIKNKLSKSSYASDIVELGFVSEEEKFALLKEADIFLFPTFYEGFGIPILEAQSFGLPVITSNISSMPEVAGCHPELASGSQEIPDQVRNDNVCSALLVDPKNPEAIAEAVQKILSDEDLKKDLMQKGLENVKRFSWEKCAEEISEIILNVV